MSSGNSDFESALDKIRQMGMEAPTPFLGTERLEDILAKHVPAILAGDSVAVPDDEEEMLWRLFFAHSQDMQGFRADIFTGGPNEARNPYDPSFRGLRERWTKGRGGDARSLVEGLGAFWEDERVQAQLRRISNPMRSVEERAQGVAPAMELLAGPWGNEATRVFAETLKDLRGPKVARKTNTMIRAYVQNAALLKRYGCSFRGYLQSVAPDLYLPSSEIVWAERKWRVAIERDFYGVGPALASYLIADWLLGLWRCGQISWFESYKEDSVFLKAVAEQNLMPAEAAQSSKAFAAYCKTLQLPAQWLPPELWIAALSPLPPRIVNEAIWLEFNASSGGGQGASGVSAGDGFVGQHDAARVSPITDDAEWPHRTWDMPPYKSPAFLRWLNSGAAGAGGLVAFRLSPAYQWATNRGLIVDDEWNEEAALFPGTVGSRTEEAADTSQAARANPRRLYEQGDEAPASTVVSAAVTARVEAWIGLSGREMWTRDSLARLSVIFSEAEFDQDADGGEPDPWVYVPVVEDAEDLAAGAVGSLDGNSGVGEAIRCLYTDQGGMVLGVYTTRERLFVAVGKDNARRIKTPLSNMCRLLLTLAQAGIALEAIVINPGTPGAVAVPEPILRFLGRDPEPLPDDYADGR